MESEHKLGYEQVKSPIETLEERGIAYLDINLTPQEQHSREEVKIEHGLAPFDYYGPVDSTFVEAIHAHLSQLKGNSEETIQSLTQLITRVAQEAQTILEREAAWVTVRVTKPNHKFDTPRWHQDGGYFASEEKTYKLVFTVKGAPTRFAEITEPTRFHELQRESSDNFIRNQASREEYEAHDQAIRHQMTETVKEIQPHDPNQAAIYLVGDEQAKVHSEPPLEEPRIFMSVVPGSVEEINALRERRTH